MLHPKKVGQILSGEKLKQTNEIGIVQSLLKPIDIDGKVISADAIHTQRRFAVYLVEERKAHYHFTVKANQKILHDNIKTYFQSIDEEPDYIHHDYGHGRIETRKIWVTTKLNNYLDFPHIKQIFAIERNVIYKKSGKVTQEIAYGITSQQDFEATPEEILSINRNHWSIENSFHYILDWAFDEDRCRIRTKYGPENITRLRKFAISVIKTVSNNGVTETMRDLGLNMRLVFDYLRMTLNSQKGVKNCRTN